MADRDVTLYVDDVITGPDGSRRAILRDSAGRVLGDVAIGSEPPGQRIEPGMAFNVRIGDGEKMTVNSFSL